MIGMYAAMQPRASLGADEPKHADSGELATTMIMRGAFGTLLGAAVAPKGREGIWGAAGFVVGTVLGQPGILAMALAALYGKANK